ncbi:MAG: serine dehydratase beta chain, partial [Nesterenkonia sp.]
MPVGLFDLFSVGVGPSSSHTVGPMRAAQRFVAELLVDDDEVDRLSGIQVELFGSLSATGAGHGTFTAILLGLEGWSAEEILPAQVDERIAAMTASGTVQVAAQLGRRRDVTLRVEDFIQRPLTHLERHSNAMVVRAVDAADELISEETYYSVGGGFVVADSDDPATALSAETEPIPYPFRTSAELF